MQQGLYLVCIWKICQGVLAIPLWSRLHTYVFCSKAILNIPHLCSEFLISGTIRQTSVPLMTLLKPHSLPKWSFNVVEFMIRGRLSSVKCCFTQTKTVFDKQDLQQPTQIAKGRPNFIGFWHVTHSIEKKHWCWERKKTTLLEIMVKSHFCLDNLSGQKFGILYLSSQITWFQKCICEFLLI